MHVIHEVINNWLYFQFPGFIIRSPFLIVYSRFKKKIRFRFHCPLPILVKPAADKTIQVLKSHHFLRTKCKELTHYNILCIAISKLLVGQEIRQKDGDWKTSPYLLLVGRLDSMYLIPIQRSVIFLLSFLIGNFLQSPFCTLSATTDPPSPPMRSCKKTSTSGTKVWRNKNHISCWLISDWTVNCFSFFFPCSPRF